MVWSSGSEVTGGCVSPRPGLLQDISRQSGRQRPAGDAGSGAMRCPRRAGCVLSKQETDEEDKVEKRKTSSRFCQIWFPAAGLLPSCWEFFAAFWWRSEFSALNEEYETPQQHVCPSSTPLPHHCPALPPLHPHCCSAAPSWTEQTRLRPLRLSSGPADCPEDS